MKTRLFTIISAVAILAGCAREADIVEVAPNAKRQVTITANILQTKSTVTDEGIYSWASDEQIAVAEEGMTGADPIPFDIVDAEAGTFGGELTGNPVFAVSPAFVADNFTTSGGNTIYDITFGNIVDYVPGTTNALMVGTPVDNSSYKFEFRHAAAVVKVPVVNVPVGTAKVKLTMDKPITGIWESLASVNPIPVIGPSEAGDNYVILTLKDVISTPNTSADFYFPVPVNTYTSFQFELLDANDNRLKGVQKSGLNVALAAADLFITPTIELEPEEEDVTINAYRLITSGTITDGDYVIAYVDGTTASVFTGVDANMSHEDYTINNNSITSSADLDALAIEITGVTGGYTLMVKDGTNANKYLGSASGNNNGMVFSPTEVVNSIVFDSEGYAEITDNSNENTHLVFNASNGTERFRYYKTTTTTGIKSINLFQKVSQTGKKLNTPTGLKVEGKVVTWNSVSHADQYVITVGETTETVTACTYTFDGTDNYYTVSVKAQTSDNSKFESSSATIPNAKFGTPTLATPSLKKGAVGENSINITWTADERASAGYLCQITDNGEYSASTTVSEGSVTFAGLSDDTEYTITVTAIEVTAPLQYEASESAEIIVSTAARTTIKSILDGNDTVAKSLSSVTVLAVSSKGVYVGDSTGWIFAQQTSTSPNDLAPGDVVNVSGTAGSQNSQRVLKTSTITKTTGSAISLPTTENVDYDDLVTLVGSFERKRISFIGSVTTVNKSNGYYNVSLEEETAYQIALYNPISDITSTIAVGKTVIVSGYTLHVTGSTTKYLYIVADSYVEANLSVTTTPASYTFGWDESGSANKQVFTIESDNSAWTIDDSEVSSWATVSKNGNKVEVYPKGQNESGGDYSGNIYVTHAVVTSINTEIFIEQKDKNATGSDHEAKIKFGSAEGSVNVNATPTTGNDSQGNTWTITTSGTTSFTPNASYSQIGSSKAPATSITFTTTLSSSATIKSMSAKFGGFSGTAGTVTLKVGDTTIGSGSLSATSDVTVSSTDATQVGTVLTVTVTDISKGVKAYEINVTYNN